MITPHFELTQDADFVIVRIRLPHLKADEGEFYVIGCEFKFHLRPYFLRLTFRYPLVEDGRERAVNDISSGVLTVWLPKETPGLHFEGLDMLAELLRRPSAHARPRTPASAPARCLVCTAGTDQTAGDYQFVMTALDTAGWNRDALQRLIEFTVEADGHVPKVVKLFLDTCRVYPLADYDRVVELTIRAAQYSVAAQRATLWDFSHTAVAWADALQREEGGNGRAGGRRRAFPYI